MHGCAISVTRGFFAKLPAQSEGTLTRTGFSETVGSDTYCSRSSSASIGVMILGERGGRSGTNKNHDSHLSFSAFTVGLGGAVRMRLDLYLSNPAWS